MRKLPKIVTVRFLKSLRACYHAVDEFIAHWPRGARVTEENIYQALQLQIDVPWFMQEVYYHIVGKDMPGSFWYLRTVIRIDDAFSSRYDKTLELKSSGERIKAITAARVKADRKEAAAAMKLWRWLKAEQERRLR